jgi:hypothetical protein
VIITSEKRFTFTPWRASTTWAAAIPEETGVLPVLDSQHRLLALHALTQAGEHRASRCPRCSSTG